jgi:N4-gp56 family major capsid protein
MAAFTAATNTGDTQSVLISKIVQDALLREAKLMPTVLDYSSQAQPGVKQIEIPKWSATFSGPAAQNADGDTAVSTQTATLAVDTLALDQWVNLPYALPDRIKTQNVVALEAELAEQAGKKFGIWIDDKIIVELKLCSSSNPDHIVQMTGTSNTVPTLADVANSRMLLNKQNVPMSERYLVMSPECEKAFLAMDNFIRADAYGAREGLLQGEIGRIFGFTCIVHNGLSASEMIAYHKSHVAFAFQKNVSYEKQRGLVTLQRDEYSFSAGAGFEVLDGGKRGVFYNSTGS